MPLPNPPLTADDLRQIANALEPIETLAAITENPMLGRIEVFLPGSDDLTGYFVREGETGDGHAGEAWYGYRSLVQDAEPSA